MGCASMTRVYTCTYLPPQPNSVEPEWCWHAYLPTPTPRRTNARMGLPSYPHRSSAPHYPTLEKIRNPGVGPPAAPFLIWTSWVPETETREKESRRHVPCSDEVGLSRPRTSVLCLYHNSSSYADARASQPLRVFQHGRAMGALYGAKHFGV